MANDGEPFLKGERSDDEIADYALGYAAGSDGKRTGRTKSEAWQIGWAEAQE